MTTPLFMRLFIQVKRNIQPRCKSYRCNDAYFLIVHIFMIFNSWKLYTPICYFACTHTSLTFYHSFSLTSGTLVSCPNQIIPYHEKTSAMAELTQYTPACGTCFTGNTARVHIIHITMLYTTMRNLFW